MNPTASERQALQSIPATLRPAQQAVGDTQAALQSVTAKREQVSAECERLRALLDPMQDAQFEKGTLALLCKLPQIEALRELEHERRKDCDRAQSDLNYQVAELSRKSVAPIVRGQYDALRASVESQLAARFPTEPGYLLYNRVEASLEVRRAAEFVRTVESGLNRPSALLALADALLNGAEVWSMHFERLPGPPPQHGPTFAEASI